MCVCVCERERVCVRETTMLDSLASILLVPPERGRERDCVCVREGVWEREREWGGVFVY